jgi:predicted GNAT family N-acyltransferase
VYVATSDKKTILGYYTLSQYSIQFADIPTEISRKLRKYSVVPATLLGRLARDISTKGQGIGELLLLDALHRALKMSEQVASAAIVPDPKDEQAIDFYKRYGFIELPKTERCLFLPMASVPMLFPK